MLGEEEFAFDVVEFINRTAEELESKKLTMEFIGRVWGDGNTALHLASFHGMSDLVKRLLELGANPNKRNELDYRPVDCADDDETREAFNIVHGDHILYIYFADFVGNYKRPDPKLFVAPPEIQTRSMRATKSFDDFASFRSAEEVAKVSAIAYPPEKTSDPVLASNNEMSLRRRNLSNPQTPTMSASMRLRSPSSPMSMDFMAKEVTAIKISLMKPKRRVAFDPVTSIRYICQYGDAEDPETLVLLKKLTADRTILNSIRTGHQGLTPLHLACSYNQIAVVRFLLKDCHVRVNITDKEGWTPLHSAAVEGYPEIVSLLLQCTGNLAQKGSDPEVFYVEDGPILVDPLNEDDDTPESLATSDEIINMLKGNLVHTIFLIFNTASCKEKESSKAKEARSVH